MKKAVVLGMILLALGTLAYADASIGFGWGRTTFTVAANSGEQILSGWGINDFPSAPRENLDIAWSGDHTAFHLTGYLDGTVLSWVGIYGTLKLMPDMFSVMIGRFDNDGWDAFRKTSPHPIRDVNNNNVGRFNGYGVIFDLAPKDSGFEAAVMYKTGDPTTGALIGGTERIMQTLNNTNVGASYTVPNTVKIVAGSQTEGTLYTPNRNIFARVELLMVPNLTAWADVRYAGFDAQPDAVSNINAELAGAYDMKPLTIVLAAVFGSNDVAGTSVTSFGVVPEVYYNMGAFTVGVYGNVMVGDSSAISDTMSWAVEPYVKLNDFNTRISVNITKASDKGQPNWEIPIMIDWGF
jgi:hypothetical protein